jgi:hypothetical protein
VYHLFFFVPFLVQKQTNNKNELFIHDSKMDIEDMGLTNNTSLVQQHWMA